MRRIKIPQGRLSAVYGLLPRGIDNPITAREISSATHIPPRNVYEILNLLVMSYDVPVGGVRGKQHRGYFIITNQAELAAAITPLRRSAREMAARVRKLAHMRIQK